METCPVEILYLIFSYACTDDGHTGRALSLVSRNIRVLSRPYQFQSIAVYGDRQIAAFADLLETLEPASRCVRHLFLTDIRRAWMEDPGIPAGLDRFRTANLLCLPGRPTAMFNADDLLRLVRLVSPHLNTLALILFNPYGRNPLSLAFPSLTELTIHLTSLSVVAHWQEPHANAPDPEITACPSLRRLHVIQNNPLHSNVPAAVSRIAPRLTHLRLSLLSPYSIHVHASDLECVLGVDDPPAPGCGYPPTLEKIVVQPTQTVRRLREILDPEDSLSKASARVPDLVVADPALMRALRLLR